MAVSKAHNPNFRKEVGVLRFRGHSARGNRAGIAAILSFLIFSSTACIETQKTAFTSNGHIPSRIISIAPSVTETLFAIGAGDRVVGVTAFCNWPDQAASLPKIGEFSHFNFEIILSLRPDMIVASKDAPSETVAYEMAHYGIPSVIVDAAAIGETIDSIIEIGKAVGSEREALELARQMQTRVAAIQKIIAGAPPVKAIIVFDHEPLILAGPGTFADDIIRLAGGSNTAADALIRYPQYSVERLVLEGPDVIIEAAQGGGYGPVDMEKKAEFWSKWPMIPAVKNGRIAVVDSDLVSRPGPRIIDGLEAVARALHPDKFSNAEANR